MKTHILLMLFLGLFAHQATAQKTKVKIKNEIATVDGSDYVQWKRLVGSNAVSVHEIGSGDEVIFLRWMSYNTSSDNDPSTRVNWVEIKFLEQELTCEITSRGNKGLVKFFVENNLFVNGELDAEAAALVVKKFGNNFSANRPESVIIINN
ncbi:MAG: hypothetical protein Crog4KO_31430 [Crocinitomicaceae bacterium]